MVCVYVCARRNPCDINIVNDGILKKPIHVMYEEWIVNICDCQLRSFRKHKYIIYMKSDKVYYLFQLYNVKIARYQKSIICY